MNEHIAQQLKGITAFIANKGLAPAEACLEAQEHAHEVQQNSIGYLIDKQFMKQSDFAHTAANAFGLRLFDVLSLSIESIPKSYLKEKLIREHKSLPIYLRGKTLTIASADPLNLEPIKQFRFSTGLEVELVLAKDKDLRSVINRTLQEHASNSLADFDDNLEDLDLDIINEQARTQEEDDGARDAPVVKFVNKVILDAIQKGASDIHFEPYEYSYRVRFRLDGVMEEVASPPTMLAPKITSRLKIMSNLDIAERRIPQDGRFKMQISKGSAIDFRVSSCPTLFGEKVVLRILDPTTAQLGIEKLGYSASQKEDYMHALGQSQGMILVTGPTGSGKTVSLYTGLNILNTPTKNISTAEDPVEINLPGVNQVNIHIKAGLTFSAALKSFLRQDPDIIMIGEIRDLETAGIAVKAAQTGHLVISTLHTNSAPETISRLINMGIESYNIAGSVIIIIAQRLARRLCDNCKQVIEIPDESLVKLKFTPEQIAGKHTFYSPKGCSKCNGGYKGRVGIFEVMTISDDMRKVIINNANAIEIAGQAQKEGINNLRQSAINKAIEGVTSLEEVTRVTQ
jgi:type IV pilus assembly protein PilB